MPFVQDNKNSSGTAPLGSIKDRIKNFEFMKENGTTSPRARSPVSAVTGNDTPRTIRRTTNWERDGNERRQMRRSERREAEMRRENELLTQKEKLKEVDTSDENIRSTRRTASRVNERRSPRVTPRVKEKPPEPQPRRRIQDYRAEPKVTAVKTQPPAVEVSTVTAAELVSPRTTESSSNETIDLNTSDDPVDMSSEELEEQRKQDKTKDEDEEGEVEAEEDEGEEEEEEEEEDSEEEGAREQEEQEEEKKGEEQEEEKDKQEEEEEGEDGQVEDKNDDNDDDNDDDEHDDHDHDHDDDDDDDDDDDEEKEEIEENTEQKSNSRVQRKAIEKRRSNEEKKEEDEEEVDSGEHGNENDYKEKIFQARESSVTDKAQNRRQLRDKTRTHKTSHTLPKQSKHHGSSGHENMERHPERGRGSGVITPTKDLPGKNEPVRKKTNENHSRGSTKTARRTLSKNSITIPQESGVEKTKNHNKKGTEGRSKKSSKNEESDSGAGPGARRGDSKKKQSTRHEGSDKSTGLSSLGKTTYINDERFGTKTENEPEVVSSSNQLNLYSSNALGMVPVNIQKSVDRDNEQVSSPDIKHEDVSTKKAFVCAIHEEPCKYYCQDCERLICSECAMRWGDCHEHYYLRVKDAWKKYREEMTKILQNARSSVSRIQEDILENSKARDSFKLKVESTIKKINSFFDEHVQALEKRRTSFLETVEETMKFREIGINQEIDGLQNNLVETSGTINVAGHVYGTSTMMEFLQVCKQLTNRLMDLGNKKCKTNRSDNFDIDFISEPNLYEEIEKLGHLRKHRLSLANSLEQEDDVFITPTADRKCEECEAETEEGKGKKPGECCERRVSIDLKEDKSRKLEANGHDSVDTSVGTSTENLSESTSTKDSNGLSKKEAERLNIGEPLEPANRHSDHKLHDHDGMVTSDTVGKCIKSKRPEKEKDEGKEKPIQLKSDEQYRKEMEIKQQIHKETFADESIVKADANDNLNLMLTPSIPSQNNRPRNPEECPCQNGLDQEIINDHQYGEQFVNPRNVNHVGNQYVRRHSMDDTIGARSKKEEIQQRLNSLGKLRPSKSTVQFYDEGERYFSSGEAEQRRRKQEYYKVRFNDRAYFSNPSDSSELEELRGFDLEHRSRTKPKVRRHRTMPLIRPISERREKSPWSLDIVRYHGKIHFSRNGLKATGKAFGWNAVIGNQGFSEGIHKWKVRVTKWTAVGVCYKDDHIDNPSWGAGNKWTWDSADMCYSPRLGVCESPVGEWIDGDVIALELDCDNSLLIVHNIRTAETDKLFGFKQPVFPYFYLSVFRSISVTEIDGVQCG